MSRSLALVVLVVVVALGLFFFVLDKPGPSATTITLATTTSTENSGLLKYLLDPWQKETGIEVRVIAVGTGKAIALAERGDADLLLVHARAREDAFMEAGNGLDRRDIMWNDFIVLGPPSDPAGVRGMTDGAKALTQIAGKQAPFISRGDDSGTHIREKALWKAAGIDPEGNDWYHKAGQGMGPCLTMADQRRAYLLADRGTWLGVKEGKDLEVLVQGDPSLRNPYGAMLVNPAKHPHVHVDAARKLLDFLTSAEGQKRIGAYTVGGEQLFHPHGSTD